MSASTGISISSTFAMLFELNPHVNAPVNAGLQASVAHFQAGNIMPAYQSALDFILRSPDSSTISVCDSDWLFLIDVFNAVGRYDSAHVFARLGSRQSQAIGLLHLIRAWDLAADGKFFDCEELLQALQRSNDRELKNLARALDAYNLSAVGRRLSAARAHDEAAANADKSPFVWYVLSRAAARRSLWDRAVDEGSRALSLAPQWHRARAALVDSLLAIGQLEQAQSLIAAVDRWRLHCAMDLSRALCREAAGDIEGAIAALRDLVEHWPRRSKLHRFAVRQAALLMWQQGQSEQAMEFLSRNRVPAFKSIGSQRGNRKYISVPLIAQAHNHCVPTAAAMVAGAQGQPANQREFAAGMMTQDGTPMHRMVDYMKSLGYRVIAIRTEPQAVESCLEQGVPLIGSMAGVFSAHVDVVCGYDTGLGLFHVRDPMHWFGRSFFYKDLAQRYNDHTGLWALISPSRIDGFTIDESWIDEPAQAYLDLSRAAAQGDLDSAQNAFSRIPDDHPLAFPRDFRARCIVITPGKFRDRLAKQAQMPSQERPTLFQVRAMLMQIDDSTADQVLAKLLAMKHEFGNTFVRYVRAQCQCALHQWRQAEETLRQLTRHVPHMESAWSELAEVQWQLGRADEAQTSFRVALDMSPDNERIKNRLFDLNGTQQTFEQRLASVNRASEENPDLPETNYQRAEVLCDGPDGLHYENALNTCVRCFPRNPWCYNTLADWYLTQSRQDLAREILKTGRSLIGEDELSLYSFEREDEVKNSPVRAHDVPDSQKSSDLPPQPTTSEPPISSSIADPAAQVSPPNRQSRFDHLVSELNKTLEQADYDGWSSSAEARELRQLHQEQNIRWWESARVVAMFARCLHQDATEKYRAASVRRDALRDILPWESVPGIPERFAIALFGWIETRHWPRPSIQLILEWIDKVCSECGRFAGLQFERAFLIEQLGRFNESEQVFIELTRTHPAYAPGYYRLGQICAARRDYSQAILHHQKCIEITPANGGALEELISLHRYLRLPDEQAYRARLVRLYPYSKKLAYELAWAIAESGDLAASLDSIAQRQNFIPARDLALIKARLLTDQQRFDDTLQILDQLEIDDNCRYQANWIRVDCLVGKDLWPQTVALLESMLSEWPTDEGIVDQLARSLRAIDFVKARGFAEEKIVAGMPLEILAYICVQSEDHPAATAQRIVMACLPERRDAAALAFHHALDRPESSRASVEFCRWCRSLLPHLVEIQESLAYRLNMLDEHGEAEVLAQSLHDADPNNPRWLRLLGICIQDKKPNESVELLEREYEITGSADSLSRLARGYQLKGDLAQAKSAYLKALERNPYDAMAMTNLIFSFAKIDGSMFELVSSALNHGNDNNAQYFHVCAVKLAIALKRTLPASWYPSAIARYQLLKSEEGFRDEPTMLRRAILAWATKHRDRETLQSMGGFLPQLYARFIWPRWSWIPPPTDTQT